MVLNKHVVASFLNKSDFITLQLLKRPGPTFGWKVLSPNLIEDTARLAWRKWRWKLPEALLALPLSSLM